MATATAGRRPPRQPGPPPRRRYDDEGTVTKVKPDRAPRYLLDDDGNIDPDKLNQALEDEEAAQAVSQQRKVDRAHVAAHKENIRRDRTAKAKADRAAAAAQRDAARAQLEGRRRKVRAARQFATRPQAPGVSDASGFVLAVVGWCWIALPLLRGGPAEVRDVWRAKFFNKGPGGEPLP